MAVAWWGDNVVPEEIDARESNGHTKRRLRAVRVWRKWRRRDARALARERLRQVITPLLAEVPADYSHEERMAYLEIIEESLLRYRDYRECPFPEVLDE